MNKQKLIALIIKKQTYKDTKPVLADILKKKQQAVTISISAIGHILKDDYNAEAKLYAVRYLKDCFQKGNQSFIAKTESKILPLLVKMVKDSENEKQIMKYGGSYTKSADLEKFKSVITSLFTMSKQCIEKWAAWIPFKDRQFVKAQKQVANIGTNPWKNGFSYFRQQNQTLFRQNCQKNGLKLSNTQKFIKKQQVNSPIQKLQQQLPGQQPKIQSNLQINSTISVENKKVIEQSKYKQKYKSIIKMQKIIKNVDERLKRNEFFSAKQFSQTEYKFNAAVNQYCEQAIFFDQHYLTQKNQEFQSLKKQNQEKKKNSDKKVQIKIQQKQQKIKQKQLALTVQPKLKNEVQSTNQINNVKGLSKIQSKSKEILVPPQALVENLKSQNKQVLKIDNKISNKNVVEAAFVNKYLKQQQDKESPTFKSILDQKNPQPNSISPIPIVSQSAINSSLNQKSKQPQIVIHPPNKSINTKNENKVQQISVKTKKNNQNFNKNQYIQQEQQRVNFTQSDDDFSQDQSQPLINKQKIKTNNQINKKVTSNNSQKITAKFILQEQFKPNIQPASQINSTSNKNLINTQTNSIAQNKLSSKLNIIRQSNQKQFSINSSNNQNNKFGTNSQIRIQQLTKQYQFQTQQLHKKIFMLENQTNSLRKNEQSLKQDIKLNQFGSNEVQFLKKKLQKEQDQKNRMQKQINALKMQLKKIKNEFDKSKESWKSFNQFSASAIQNNQNNFSQKPSQISRSSYKVKKIKPIITQNQQHALQQEAKNKTKANVLPIQTPVSINALKMRIDQDYINNMTHYQKIGSWLSSDNILRFRLCILGVSDEFYKDQNLLIYKMQNLFCQNGAQFLKMTFSYHFKRIQQVIPKAVYKNIAEVDFWTKPMTGQNQIFSQQTICRLCLVPMKIMKSTINFNNTANNATFLLPFLFYNFLRPIEFESDQFSSIFSSRNHQTIKSKVIHLDGHIACTAVDFCKIFKQSKLNNQFLEICLTQQAEQKVYMTQIQLLRNQKAVIRVLTIPSNEDMHAKAKQLVNNLVFLLSAQ